LVPSYFPNAFEHDIGEYKRQNAIQQPTKQSKWRRGHSNSYSSLTALLVPSRSSRFLYSSS